LPGFLLPDGRLACGLGLSAIASGLTLSLERFAMSVTKLRDPESEEIMRRSAAALADRRARGEIMTYLEDGWVYREYPGMRVVRICRLEDYRAEDHPTAG
jgi:hypothetical protein